MSTNRAVSNISGADQGCGPLVSVIVPIYNTEPYLRRCLESIASQTYKNLQVICVDDGSTDGSRAVCLEFAQQDNRFLYIYQENAGQSAARNTGISYMNGDYVAFIDSDDYWDANIVERLLEVSGNHDAQFVMCQVMHEGFPDVVDIIEDWGPYVCSGDEMIRNVLLSRNGFSAAAHHSLFSASVVAKSRFLEGHVFEDVEYLVQIAPQVDKAVTISERLYHYCWRADNSSARPLRLRVKDMRAVTNSLAKILATSTDDHRAELDQRFISNMMGMAREAVWSMPSLFEEIRLEICEKEFIAALQPKSVRVLRLALGRGRLAFASICTLYSVFRFCKKVVRKAKLHLDGVK